jgi:hypothetical protein
MTITQAITISGILLSAFVALSVAYLHRKQMRQIEIFKQDPSAGLIPPPTKLTSFIKGKWDTFFAYGGPIYILGNELIKDSPITRTSVILISLSFSMLVLNISLALVFRLQSKFNERTMKLLEFHERQAEISKQLADSVFPGEKKKHISSDFTV